MSIENKIDLGDVLVYLLERLGAITNTKILV